MRDIFIGVCKRNRGNILIGGIFTLFFGFLLITGEPVYVGDTLQYEEQTVMREPVYALLIQFIRLISPEKHYWFIIMLQNILAAAANTAFIIILRKKFALNMPVSLIFVVIQLMPHMMTPVFARTHLMITNSLMTEGISCSVYPLAFLCLLNAVWLEKPLGKDSIVALLFFLFISLIRGQMMVMLVVWFCVMTVLVFEGRLNMCKVKDKGSGIKNTAKRWLLLLLMFVVAFCARTVIVRVYNYCESGLFVDTASGKAMSFANILYVADREDGEAIEDEKLRALFFEIYDAADEDEMNYKYAEGGIIKRAEYHEYCHDKLNFIYFNEMSRDYIGETRGIYVDRFDEFIIALDDLAAELSSYLMPRVFLRYAANYINIIALGFVRTVAYEHWLLVWYAVAVYAAAVALTIILWHKNPKSRAAAFMAVLLLAIVGNVCATALMIQCISRYMIYNLPLFYIAGILEILELARYRAADKIETVH